MTKLPTLKQLGIVLTTASIAVSTSLYGAVIDPDMPAVVDSNNALPTDMADWLERATQFSWNPVNVRLGKHPDHPDGVVYIFPDASFANAWWDGSGAIPDGIPSTAVGYIHWELDNDSGEFPGIMAVTDDYQFKTNNCIMASGTTIPTPDGSGAMTKTCSNYQGSSKRFKMVVLQADQDIDLVFNMTTKALEYQFHAISDFPDKDWFRIYRYITKFGNGTATDPTDGAPARNGDRILGISVELGTYDVLGGGFQQITDTAETGLSYELTECIEDRYFDQQRVSNDPDNDCDQGETEIWLDNEYATFSPAMYSLPTDKRTSDVGGGYWDKHPAGIFPPQMETDNKIDSGTGTYSNPYDPYNTSGVGQIGQTTSNYFDVAASQAITSGLPFPDNMFGYLMHYGVFANDDPGNIAMGIYEDDDGDPATSGSLYAWWDGSHFRWGIDRDQDGNVGPNAWEILSDADLAYVASRRLDETRVLAPPRFEFGYMDDLGSLNMDTFIKIANNYDPETNPQFAVRFRAASAASEGLTSGAGVDDAPWVSSPMPAEDDFFDEIIYPSDSDSGWCSYNPNARFDPVLPGLLLAGLAYLGLGWRCQRKSAD